MTFEFKIAFRYFRARRKSLARFTSLAAIIGIAAGVAALILANALAKGFADEMQNKILANTAHIAIFAADGAEIFDWETVKEQLETIENIENIAPTSYENALLIGETETSYAILKVQNQSNNVRGLNVAVGAKLAEKLNLKIGDTAEIATIENQTPSRVRVAEIFQTGLYDYDATWIRIAPENYARLHRRQIFTPTILNISVKDIYRANQTAAEIRQIPGDKFKVVDWQEANQPLFAALSLERKVALAIISLIIFIAALNITTTLALLVNERRLDIAVLRTCGAKARSLTAIFLLEGLFLGFAGILLGVISGLLGCFLANYFKLVSLPAEVYSLNQITLAPTLANVLLIACAAFPVCLAGSVFPALKASKIKPLENLRRQ
ncbi:MAG: ABC transporter permease [Pyrinomonadaceae bacterium]|nr:ABC transporter permease [Pyrinomonadaceae bacterium]